MAVNERLLERLFLKLRADAEDLAQRMSTEIQKLIASGMDEQGLVAFLKRDIAERGPLLGMIRSTMNADLGGAIGEIQQDAVREQFSDPETIWVWIDIQDERECEDCERRHGVRHTYAEWEAIGLPGVGATRCRYRCRCELVPEDEVGKDPELVRPIKVKTVAEYRADYERSKAA